MTSINLELGSELSSIVNMYVSSGLYSDSAEYIKDLIRNSENEFRLRTKNENLLNTIIDERLKNLAESGAAPFNIGGFLNKMEKDGI